VSEREDALERALVAGIALMPLLLWTLDTGSQWLRLVAPLLALAWMVASYRVLWGRGREEEVE